MYIHLCPTLRIKQTFGCVLIAFFTLVLGAWSPMGEAQEDSSYRLGPGDQIKIAVFGEDDLTFDALLSDGGTLSYPFLGELKLRGQTISQLQNTITAGLADGYLINPKVTVTITQYRPFYINGEVRQPGGYPFQPGLTVLKAISLAGGFTERSARDGIYLQQEGRETHPPAKVGLDDRVKPGDTISVKQSFF